MAKVVLVWNEHPTEVVAGFHARKVAEILKNKYGHDVVIEKIPVAETNYGIIRNGKGNKANQLLALRDSIDFFPKDPSGTKFMFNFHAAPAERIGKSTQMPARLFKVSHKRWQDNLERFATEITIIKGKGRQYAIEMPGYFTRIPGNAYRKMLEQKREFETKERSKIDRKISAGTYTARDILKLMEFATATQNTYTIQRTALHTKRQKKFLSSDVSKKIAAAIHERINASNTKPRRT
ncbi:MAG: hypothetical protein V1722_00280 [Candidatus Micrarchaeota archaeon]